MNKKKLIKIEDLTNDYDNIMKIFDNNEKLQEIAESDLKDNLMFWLDEYLDYIKLYLMDWSFGFYEYNYIKVDKCLKYEFLIGLEKLNKDFCFFNNEDEKLLFKALELYNDLEEKEEEETEELYQLIRTLIRITTENFDNNLNYTQSDIEEYFIEYTLDTLMNDNYFYDSETFEVFQHIDYMKSYK